MATPKTTPAKKRAPAKRKKEPVATDSSRPESREEKDAKLEPMPDVKEPVAVSPMSVEVSRRIDTDDDDFELPADFMPPEEDQSDEAAARRPDRYFEAVGRRKSAIARVRLFTRAGDFSVNGKLYEQYFTTIELRNIVEDSLKKMKLLGRFRVSAKMSGGGMHGQAEALRHGLARCLVKFNPDFRKRLRRAGFMTRDPRVKERKKFGLKKARRAPQWAKR